MCFSVARGRTPDLSLAGRLSTLACHDPRIHIHTVYGTHYFYSVDYFIENGPSMRWEIDGLACWILLGLVKDNEGSQLMDVCVFMSYF